MGACVNDFNYPLNNLPLSLKYLTIGNNFNQLAHNLPPLLKKIKFSEDQREYFVKISFDCEICITR